MRPQRGIRSDQLLAILLLVGVAGCGDEVAVPEQASTVRDAQSRLQPAGQPAPEVDDLRAGDPPEPEPARFGFESDSLGVVPRGFTAVLSGRGSPGRWEVVAAGDAPSGEQAVAQSDQDRTSYRFPLLVLGSPIARDVELEVAGKPISGTRDQAIGLIWRYQDADNYYVVRANALEDNVVLYKMEAGERSDLDLEGKEATYGLDVEVPKGAWSRLAVRARGSRFTVYLDGRELFQVVDETFAEAGKVGLWTKADSVTWFDDLRVTVLDAAAPTEGAEDGGSE